MTKILIKLDSIRKNPEYEDCLGGFVKRIPGNYTVEFTCKGKIPKKLQRFFNVYSVAWSSDGEEEISTGTISGNPNYKYIVDACKQEKADITIHVTREMIDVTSINSPPEYLYEYEVVPLECEECSAIFSSDLLESDSEEIGEFYVSSDKICPHCKVWDCCQVEWETVEEAFERQKLIDKEA